MARWMSAAGRDRRLVIAVSAVAGALMALPSPASAQSDLGFDLRRRIIMERRIADDREAELIRQHDAERQRLQAQIAAARRRGASARTTVTRLSKQLADAEKRENDLLGQILQRDPASKIFVADLETSLSQLSATASAKLKPVLTTYGQGKRSEAWPAIDSLTRNGTAREKRIAAQLRMTMFNLQDPGVTAEDVRQHWRAAVDADPSNALALTSLATAEQYVGHIQDSLDLLGRAAAVASTPQERYVIASQRVATAYAVQDPELMVTVTRELLTAIQGLAGPDIADASRKWLEAQATVSLAGYLGNTGKLTEASELYARASDMLGQLQKDAPTWRFIDDALASVLYAQATAETQLNRPNEALEAYAEAIRVLEARIAANPADAAIARQNLSQDYANACNIEFALKHNANAQPLCANALKYEKLAPKSAFRDFRLAADSAFFGKLLVLNGQDAEAKEHFRYAAGLWKELVALQSIPPNLAGYADALTALASLDPEVCWRDVAAAWEALKETSELTREQQRARLDARSRGRAGQGCDLQPPPELNRSDPSASVPG